MACSAFRSQFSRRRRKSKQLSVLLRRGILRNPLGRLYKIVPYFIADNANRTLEFGYCVIRLNVGT